jgi:hypothetical protein
MAMLLSARIRAAKATARSGSTLGKAVVMTVVAVVLLSVEVVDIEVVVVKW